MSLDRDVEEIKQRNRRVEEDKAWETSWTRALIIAVFTYVVAGVWLMAINDSQPLLKAFIPAVGYLLSTFSLPLIRQLWIQRTK